MVVDTLNRLIGLLENACGPPSLRDVLRVTLEGLGFNHFAYRAARIPANTRTPFWITTYPNEWSTHYAANFYSNIDPVVIEAEKSMLPFKWQSAELISHTTKPQRAFIGEAAEFGILNGFTVPIHGPNNEFASLTVTSDVAPDEFENRCRAYGHELFATAYHFHLAAVRTTSTAKEKPAIHLSLRERECLLWTSRGKSAWEVGAILRISERTVTFHLTNAMRKLGVYTKTFAVVKSIILGLIHP